MSMKRAVIATAVSLPCGFLILVMLAYWRVEAAVVLATFVLIGYAAMRWLPPVLGRVGLSSFVALVVSIPIAVAACLQLYCSARPNYGLPIGYYGKQNRVLAKLRACPGIEILQVRTHSDLSLEDFSVTVSLDSSEERDLLFENANIRSYDDLVSEFSDLNCP